jgi:4-aminobutyrate aminotransferase-like enzyme
MYLWIASKSNNWLYWEHYTLAEDVAGIVFEAVQGEGGYFPVPQNFLKELRRICNENGIPLIVDEVHSEMGRREKILWCWIQI